MIFSDGAGPRDFKLQYSLDNSLWTDVTGGTIVATTSLTNTGNISLPSACSNQPELYLRLIMTSDFSVVGETIDPGAICDIKALVVLGSAPLAPTTQAANITFIALTSTTIQVGCSPGNGTRRLIVVNTSNSFTNPADNDNPTANSNYSAGSGEQVVLNGTAGSVTVTVASLANTYWFRVYEYNYNDAMTRFNTTTATANPNKSQLDIITLPTSANIGLTTATLGGTIANPGTGTIVTRGIAWGTSAGFSFAAATKYPESSASTGTFTLNVTGITRSRTIYYRAYIINSTGTTMTDEASFSNIPIFTGTGNWETPGLWSVNGSPDNTLDRPVIRGTCTITAAQTCNTLTVDNGYSLSINPGQYLTVASTLTNNAGTSGLVLKSDATGTGSLMHNTANINASVERYIASWTDANHGWHFLSSPVASQAISGFHNAGSGNDFYKWDEQTNIWINRTATGGGLEGSFETAFFVGRGYLIANSATSTKTFSGKLNVANVPLTGLPNTPGQTYTGWHLVGNPFSSAIKWTQGTWAKTNVGTFPQIWNESTASYKVLAGGGVIPAQNGFMVYVAGGGGSLTIPANARVHSDSAWYKNSASENGIVLVAHDPEGKTAQESIINFNPAATDDFDMEHDSYFMAGFAPMFYSLSHNKPFALNTLPELKDEMVVPLGFVKNQSSNFTIELSQNIPGQTIYLIDLKTNTEHKISESPYNFTSENGDNANRFLLRFGTTGIGETPTTPKINAWVYNNMLYVNNPDGNTQIEVFDLAGKRLLSTQLSGLGLQGLQLQQPAGLYLIRLTSNGKTQTIKANINID